MATWRWMLRLALCAPTVALAQADYQVDSGRVQNVANGILSLMQYTLVPDVTTSSLSITDAGTDNPGMTISQLGGGFTVSSSVPVYLEGNAAYSRYDPRFVASNGEEQREISTKWNTLSATIGIGWDFPVAKYAKLRPIANFSLGSVKSDAGVAAAYISHKTDSEIAFLDNGKMNAYGYGGGLMFDIEKYQPKGDFDFEARYTYIRLQSLDDDDAVVHANAVASAFSVWTRWRAPILDWQLLENPVRYVLELASSNYFGESGEALGFNRLVSFGTGFELDSSAYPVIITRTRLVGRYLVGNDVRGWSVGIACSF